MKLPSPRVWLAWASKNKTPIIAGILAGGELVVTMGFPLPGSEYIPQKWRGALIGVLAAAAFYFRWKANKEAGRQSA